MVAKSKSKNGDNLHNLRRKIRVTFGNK